MSKRPALVSFIVFPVKHTQKNAFDRCIYDIYFLQEISLKMKKNGSMASEVYSILIM